MTGAVIVAILLIPLIIYGVAAFRVSLRPNDIDDFFIAKNDVEITEFSNASVAYGIQIASLSIFFAWGYNYGFGAVVNPLFWGFGIVLFAAFLPRLGPFLEVAQTLHGFVGCVYRSRTLTIIASLMTITGFLGAFTAELVWGSAVLRVIDSSPAFITTSLCVMAAFVLFYVLKGGNLSVIKTDQWQLVFAHLGFVSLVVLLTVLLRLGSPQGNAVSVLLSSISGIILGLITRTIYRQVREQESSIVSAIRQSLPTLLILLVTLFGSIALFTNAALSWPSENSFSTIVNVEKLVTFEQGPINLVSLALLPLVWQFADITMWQRLSSVRGDFHDPVFLQRVKRGLIRYALESPANWILAIIAGIALRHADIGITSESVYDGVGQIPIALVSASTLIDPLILAIAAGLFGAAILSAMLSTADAFVMANAFTFVYDLLPRFNYKLLHEEPSRAIFVGRAAAIFMVLISLSSYWISSAFGFDLITLLFGAFSAQVSMFAPVVGGLLLRDRVPSAWVAVLSILFGFASAVTSTIIALFDNSWALYAPLFALGASVLVYVVGFYIDRWNDHNTLKRWISQWPWESGRFLVWFLIMFGSVFGAMGFGLFSPFPFWKVWESVGIIFTGIYTIAMWVEWFASREGELPNNDLLASRATGIYWACQIIATVLLVSALVSAWLEFMPYINIFCLIGSSVLFYVAQIQIRDYPRPGKENNPRYLELRRNAAATIRYSEGPTILTFSILACFVFFGSFRFPDITVLDAFVGGAVSFQLLLSNAVFGMHYGVPEQSRRRSAHLSQGNFSVRPSGFSQI